MNADLLNHFQGIEDLYNKALIKRNLKKLNSLLIEDWTLQEKQFGKLKKNDWINSIDNNELMYLSSKKRVTNVKLYNQIAIVTSEGTINGIYKSDKFNKSQITINSYRRFGEHWCMFSSKETELLMTVTEKVNFNDWLKIHEPKRMTG